MRAVIEAAAGGDAYAELAVEVYVHRLRASIAAMAAAMDGLDVVVWTGGVGEHAPAIRAAAAEGLGLLGVRVDHNKNWTAAGDRDLTAHGATARALVVARSRKPRDGAPGPCSALLSGTGSQAGRLQASIRPSARRMAAIVDAETWEASLQR